MTGFAGHPGVELASKTVVGSGGEHEFVRYSLTVEGRAEQMDVREYTGIAWTTRYCSQNRWCSYWCGHTYRAEHASTVIRRALRDPRNDPASMMRVTRNLAELRTVLSRAETGVKRLSKSEPDYEEHRADLGTVVAILDKYRRIRG